MFIRLLLCLLLLASPCHALSNGLKAVIAMTGTAADITAPTVSTATIGTNGTTLTLGMSETVTRSGGTFDVDCPSASNITATYSSGSGSNSLVYTLGSTVLQSDSTNCNLDYNGAANGIEDAAGNDLASITDKAITNNSTQSAITWITSGDGSYESTVTEGNTSGHCAEISLTAHTYTQIGVYINTVGSATECKLALYDQYATTRLADGGTFSPTTGYNDKAISYAASAGTYVVCFECNATDYVIPIDTGGTGRYTTDNYATFPSLNPGDHGTLSNTCYQTRAGY